MKFEYKLNYDFISKKITFEITKMPELLRGKSVITKIDSDTGKTWEIRSYLYPELCPISEVIYLCGTCKSSDYKPVSVTTNDITAVELANILKKAQEYIENYDEEVLMTVAEIEAKLGIKNLKIVKEN